MSLAEFAENSDRYYAEVGKRFVAIVASKQLTSGVMEYAGSGAVTPAATAPQTKTKPKCVKGYSCGMRCIPQSNKCHNKADGQAGTYIDWLKLSIGTGNVLSDTHQASAVSAGLVKDMPSAKPLKTVIADKQVNQQKESSTTIAKFSQIDDRKAFNQHLKEWATGIKDVENHGLLHIDTLALNKQKEELESAKTGEFKPRNVQFVVDGTSKTLAVRSREVLVKFLEHEITSAERQIAKAKKALGSELAVEGERANDATTIYTDMKDSLKDRKNKAGGVLGNDGKMKAAYTYRSEKDSIYVDYLVTSPDNLLKGGSGVKGAGTEAIKQLIRKSIDVGKEGRLTLFALENAIPFYKKLGFEGESESLALSASAAKKILNQQ